MDLFMQQEQQNRECDVLAPGVRAAASLPDARVAYGAELAYEGRRLRRRMVRSALRIVGAVVLVPVAVVLVFLAAYALTCILEGASPDELAQAFADLFERVGAIGKDALQLFGAR